MRVWVLGAEGLVGRALSALLHNLKIEHVGSGKGQCDITSIEAILSHMDRIRPTHIVNAAAYTDVDGAEKNRDLAFCVNAIGPELLGMAARRLGTALLHISSDYVFGTHYTRPCVESDPCTPTGVYATSKWEGEQRLLNVYGDACIVRTSWVFGASGKNFLSLLPQMLQTQDEVHVDGAQRGRPTYVQDLAKIIISLLPAKGVFHFANEGICSRYEVAEALCAMMKEKAMPCAHIHSCHKTGGALRPAYSVLDTTKLTAFTGKAPRPWQEALCEMLV